MRTRSTDNETLWRTSELVPAWRQEDFAIDPPMPSFGFTNPRTMCNLGTLTDPRTKSDLRTIRDPRSILCDLGVLTAATGRVCSQLSQLCTDFVHGSVAPQLPPAKCDVYLMQQHANLGAPTESLNQSVSNQVYDWMWWFDDDFCMRSVAFDDVWGWSRWLFACNFIDFVVSAAEVHVTEAALKKSERIGKKHVGNLCTVLPHVVGHV